MDLVIEFSLDLANIEIKIKKNICFNCAIG